MIFSLHVIYETKVFMCCVFYIYIQKSQYTVILTKLRGTLQCLNLLAQDNYTCLVLSKYTYTVIYLTIKAL